MIKENDFIEIEYTGKTKEGIIFDTTDEKIAKENNILQKTSYGPVVICLGQGQIIAGLDKNLVDKEVGKEYKIELQPEEAFGKKSAKLVHLISTAKFKESSVVPQPGLQVNIDGAIGIVKTVSGGRTLVDFNHPLSGRVVEYNVKILRKVEDNKEKLSSYLKLAGLDAKVELNEGKANVQLKNELPKEIQLEMLKKLKEILPSIKELEFRVEEKHISKESDSTKK